MMEEVELYYDAELKNKVNSKKIEFDTIDSGKISFKELWVKNNINFPINLDITLKGNNVQIMKSVEQLPANGSDSMRLKCTPKLFTKEPIRLELELDYGYIVI